MFLYGFIIAIHVFVSIVLILVILLQAGKGGGLSEAFGGSSTQTIFGQSAPTFLTKATSVCAVIFIFTCLTLAVMSSKKSHSIMKNESLKGSMMAPVKADEKNLKPVTNDAKEATKAANGTKDISGTGQAADTAKKVAPAANEVTDKVNPVPSPVAGQGQTAPSTQNSEKK